jgi:hypothetical protein
MEVSMKTNRFLLAVACATMAFTLFACSDDKDDTPATPVYRAGGCVFDEGPWPETTVCMKTSEVDLSPAFCAEMNDGTFVDDCPPNPKLECPDKNDMIYVYGNGVPSGIKCSDIPKGH